MFKTALPLANPAPVTFQTKSILVTRSVTSYDLNQEAIGILIDQNSFTTNIKLFFLRNSSMSKVLIIGAGGVAWHACVAADTVCPHMRAWVRPSVLPSESATVMARHQNIKPGCYSRLLTRSTPRKTSAIQRHAARFFGANQPMTH